MKTPYVPMKFHEASSRVPEPELPLLSEPWWWISQVQARIPQDAPVRGMLEAFRG